MSILELTERMKELNLRLMEKNRDGAGVAANRIIQQIDALKVVTSIFLSKSCLAYYFLLDVCISADQWDEELPYVLHIIR
jgi:hypothetical protein